jgi:glyoxylate reductase
VVADRLTRAGQFKGWGMMFMLGGDVYGKTLGVVGAGRIGTAVALRAGGFRMKVLYCSKEKNEVLERGGNAIRVSLERLLKESDFVSLHVPLTPETHQLIGTRELGLMKPTAYLINTSRGAVVDEGALVEALRSKDIAGAGLDVYENEPVLHEGLKELENTVLLPHIGSASLETRGRMAEMAATNLVAMLRGERPPNCVNLL